MAILLAAALFAAEPLICLQPMFGGPFHAAQSDKKPSASAHPFPAGFPAPEEARTARADADFQRAVTAYRFWYPTVSCEALFQGIRARGFEDGKSMQILSAQPHHQGFTLNSDTPYGGGVIDLKLGPFVVELPPGPFVALADDHHQRWIMDMGLPGPDGGRGGKHLILPPDYQGSVPKGYFVGRSSTYKVLLALRSLPLRADIRTALDRLRAVRIYPLSSAPEPRLVQFRDMTGTKMESTMLGWEDDMKYWYKLHEVVDAEPVAREFRPMYGLLAALGIEKRKPFEPDERMQEILKRAARVGREQMLLSAFDSCRPDRLVWQDRKWEWVGLVFDNADFETEVGLDLEARDRWFVQAIVASPVMFRRKVGQGSLYWLGHRDATGKFLDGGRTYKLTVPQPVPAVLFWSVTAYDASTRSQIQADQNKAALRSLIDLKDKSRDSTLDLFFGPTPPVGKEGQWIQTIPGRGWFAYMRIYGPRAPAFNGSWKPGDFEEIKLGAARDDPTRRRGWAVTRLPR
jgi:hypothetical protein